MSRHGNLVPIIVLFVNYILIAVSSRGELERIKTGLKSRLKMKYRGTIKAFLGVQVVCYPLKRTLHPSYSSDTEKISRKVQNE